MAAGERSAQFVMQIGRNNPVARLIVLVGAILFTVWLVTAQLGQSARAATGPFAAGADTLGPLAQVTQQDAGPRATPPEGRDGQPRETVHADVAARRVPITSSFVGTKVIVFGAVDNSRQAVPESGYYDVVIIVEGATVPFVARRKSRVAGIWINTDSARYDTVPSYYAIVSTRPLSEIATPKVLKDHNIGLDAIPMVPVGSDSERAPAELDAFRKAVVRIKRSQELYRESQYGVAFIGPSLFRASIDLPANVTVGPFKTHVFLFRQGKLLSKYTTRLTLEREGLEHYLHNLAFGYPFIYGIVCVIAAVCAGLIASTIFRRGGSS